MRNPFCSLIALALLASGVPSSAEAQDARFDELKRATANITAMIDADQRKSALCKGYVGKLATPTGFDAMARSVPKITEKSEFETTAQYQSRMTAAKAQSPGGPYVLLFEADREHIHYDADLKAMVVEAGALRTDHYSDEPGAELAAWGIKREAPSGGVPMFHSRGPARLVRTYSTTSRSGVPFRVSEFERNTNSLYITSGPLFSFAKHDDTQVMGFEVPLARAPLLKQTLKLALVVTPEAPYLYRHSFGPVVPSLSSRSVYKEFVTVAIVKANCSLVLDTQNRVLASMDTGS